MSAAEIILRIGAGIGGWLVFVAHALVIAVLPRADCDPRSDELWLGTLVLALLSGAAVALLGLGLRWRQSLRWFAAPAVALAVYAAIGVVPSVAQTSLDGGPLCAMTAAGSTPIDLQSFPATGLQRSWPPVQLLVLALGCAQGARFWRAPAQA